MERKNSIVSNINVTKTKPFRLSIQVDKIYLRPCPKSKKINQIKINVYDSQNSINQSESSNNQLEKCDTLEKKPKANHQCLSCGMPFTDISDLYTHIKKHFTCNICKIEFTTRKACIKHSEIHQPKMKPFPFKCQICNLQFLTKEAFMTHEHKLLPMIKDSEENRNKEIPSKVKFRDKPSSFVPQPILKPFLFKCLTCELRFPTKEAFTLHRHKLVPTSANSGKQRIKGIPSKAKFSDKTSRLTIKKTVVVNRDASINPNRSLKNILSGFTGRKKASTSPPQSRKTLVSIPAKQPQLKITPIQITDNRNQSILRYSKDSKGKNVELYPETNVYIDRDVLNAIVKRTKKQSELAEALLLHIYTDEALLRCTLMGAECGGSMRHGLHPQAKTAILSFVQRHAQNVGWEPVDDYLIIVSLHNKLSQVRSTTTRDGQRQI